MSELAIELGDWPNHAVVCAESLEAASPQALNQPVSSVRDMIVELSGPGPQSVAKLIRYLMVRLASPELHKLDLPTLERAVKQRLKVVSKANRRVTLVLNNGELLATELWSVVLTLVKTTPLRLLVIGDAQQLPLCKKQVEGAGLAWQKLGQTSTPASATARTAWVLGVGIALVLGTAGLWLSRGDTPELKTIEEQTAQPPPNRKSQTRPELQPQPAQLIAPEPPSAEPVSQPEPVSEPVTSTPLTPVTAKKPPLFPQGTRYTIQIATYNRDDFRQDYLRRVGSQITELRSVDAIGDGRRRMLVVFGAFAGYKAALAATNNLPPQIDLGDPYIIAVDDALVRPNQERNE